MIGKLLHPPFAVFQCVQKTHSYTNQHSVMSHRASSVDARGWLRLLSNMPKVQERISFNRKLKPRVVSGRL